MWAAIVVTAVGCYALKLAGLSVPESVLDRPFVRRLADMVPVALLSAIVAVEAFSSDQSLVVDARLAGIGAGALALVCRAPFIVVVVVAAATTAVIRLIGG